MILKKLSSLFKKNLTLFFVIAFGITLLESFADYSNLLNNKLSFNPTATINAGETEVCERDFMIITFEGTNGTAPYVFNYTINGGAEQTITSNNLGIAEINFQEVFAGTYTYKLTGVKDSSSEVIQIDNQEASILVNALPIVAFTFDKNNVCASEFITFTPQVSGAGDFKYLWTFEDGVTSELENPSHSLEAFGCSTDDITFRVTLKVTDKNGCSNSVVNFVTVTSKPNLEFFDLDANDFNNCDNATITTPEFKVNVGNNSNSPCVNSYDIDWGDGTTETSITFPITHTYLNLGIYEMKVKGNGENGCFNELTYQVINISPPVGDFTSLETTNNVCITDAEIDFEIANFATNWEGTTYNVDFGDGSPIEAYTHAEIVNNNKLTHTYDEGSCTLPNGEYVATLTVENLCSKIEKTINNIKILEPSTAEFESVDISCINSNVEFINTSIIGENDDCNKAANFTWDFGDGTIVNDNGTGVLTNQIHQYASSGNFTVTLSITTQCGTDIFTKDICIEEVNTPTFTVNNESGCIPFNVAATNTTNENTVCSAASYEWEVTYAAGNCETTSSWSFTNGTNENSENPEFLFSNAGFYTLIQKIITGCGTEINSKTIEVKKPPTAAINPINDACDNLTINPIAIVKNCTSNAVGITYNWTFSGGNPSTANTLDPGNIVYDAPGNYEITLEVTGECGVSNVATQTFEVFQNPTITNTILTQEICSNENTSEINLTSNIANTTYSWSATASSGISGFTANGNTNTIPSQTVINNQNTSGTLTYEVIPSVNGCQGDAVDFTITVNTAPRFTTQPISSEICKDSAATLLEVAFENGTGTASYQWFSNTIDSNSGGNLISGAINESYNPPTNIVGELFYYVEISFSSGGCSKIASNTARVNILESPTINPIEASKTYCRNEISNDLAATYSGGNGTDATYQWFSNTIDSNTGGTEINGATTSDYNPPTNVVGTVYYYVEISFTTDGCNTIVSNTATININEIPVISSAETAIYSEETFTFNPNSVAGNVVPNTTLYSWSSPSFAPAGSILGASAISIPQELISQTLENTTDSPIKVTYIITPTSRNCIGTSFTLEVTVNPGINPNAVIVNSSCFEANDGSITTNITGGIPFDIGNPYITSWTGPNGFTSTEASISNLEPGLYTITIEDKQGFTATEEFSISEPDTLELTKDLEKNTSCFNGNDGVIEVTINGGTLPYTYNWTTMNGSGIIPNQKNQNTLTKGTYTLEVIDKNNCSVSANFVLTEPEELQIDLIAKDDNMCFGEAFGSLEVNVYGGTATEITSGIFDYSYNWSGPNGFTSTSKNIENLIGGTYILNVIDNLTCSKSASFTIDQPDEVKINFTKTDESCYQKSDGSIDVILAGGVAPYTYSWSNSATGLSLSNLAPDTYIITVIDANNCSQQQSIVINDAIFFIEPMTTPMTCNSENDASIDLNLTGGIAPISIVWSDGVTNVAQRSNLAAGTYTVQITDSNPTQCPIVETFIVTNPTPIVITETVIDATDCDIENSGSINLDISGGVEPYTFLWSNNKTTEDLENIGAGDYTVTITDANNCVIVKEYNIFRQDPLDVTLNEMTLKDCNLKTTNKQVTASASGGFSPYTYSWSTGTISGDENNIMTTSQSDTYVLTVTDDKGCTIVKTIDIDVPIIGIQDFTFSSSALTNYNFLSIKDPIEFTSLSTGDYIKIIWDFGDGTTSNEENPIYTYNKEGIYTIKYTVEYDVGCTYTLEENVNISKGYILINPTAFTPNGDGINETIRPTHKGFSEIEMTIYSTWGAVLYNEKNLNFTGWDGLIKGTPAENGNYIMVIKGRTFFDEDIIETAPFTLIK